jgi:hypothetical protein
MHAYWFTLGAIRCTISIWIVAQYLCSIELWLSCMSWDWDQTSCHSTFYSTLICFLYLNKMVVQDGDHKAEPRSSYVEGARDVAVLEAMLESSEKQGAPVEVKRF